MATCPGLELLDTGGSPIGLFLWTPGLSLAQDHCRLLSAQSLGSLVDSREDFFQRSTKDTSNGGNGRGEGR